jgi:heme oxygenase
VDVLQRLKIETAPAHSRIEAALDLESMARSREAYRAVLARFYGFHKVWEPAAEQASHEPEFLAARRKTALLEQDLLALGMAPAEIAVLPTCDPLMPLPDSRPPLGPPTWSRARPSAAP